MEAITLFIAVATSAVAIFVRPVYALLLYIAALVWYPSYLTVPIGTIDFTTCRILILAIHANLLLRSISRRRFEFIWLDKIVIIYFTAQIISGAVNATSLMALLENRAGAIFDMVLPYFAVRMTIINKKQYLTLLKGILVIAAPLAIIGFNQCLTGYNPVGFLMKYNPWSRRSEPIGYVPLFRKGFFRANVTFRVSIMFGLLFAMFGPVCAGLARNISNNKLIYVFGLGLMAVGVFSSMSSGPMLAAILAILFLAFYRYRRYWKTALAIVILMVGAVEFISNRHFYDVLGDFTLNPATAWYRSELIERALFKGGMSGHWLTGFGYGVDPGWGPLIDGRQHTDMVNHYLLVLSRFGLAGFVPFFALNVVVVRNLVNAYKASILESDKWLIWCLSAGLFGLAGAFVSVSLFGPPVTIYYMMIAFAGVMPAIAAKPVPQDIVKPELSPSQVFAG